MPTTYKRKTSRCYRTNAELLRKAAEECKKGESLRKVAAMFGLDKMTLQRYIKKVDLNGPNVEVGYTPVALSHCIIPPEMERDLAAHILLLADQYHGLSLPKCRELAYKFAVANNVNIPKSWITDQTAGKAWWFGFKARHNLSLRAPEATSVGRASAFNRHNATQYFKNLASVLEEHKFEARQVFNLDETGVTTVQNPRKIVTSKGAKNVGAITSGERGELVTLIYAICATGGVIPPLLVFPRKRYKDHFIRGGPQGCIGRANPSGWSNQNIFVDYLDHFANHSQCSQKNKVLLILDNHDSHISLAAIDKCKSLGIVLLTIPPHTSHHLQPLDKSVFYSFKTAYNSALDSWNRSNPGKRVSIYDVPQLVNQAQLAAIVPRNIVSGFEHTGNWPFNPDIFTDVDFAPSNVTDRDFVSFDGEGISVQPILEATEGSESMETVAPGTSESVSNGSEDMLLNSSTPALADEESRARASTCNRPSTSYVSPSDITPLPRASPRKRKQRERRKGKTQIFTLTPVRNEVAERENAKLRGKNVANAKKKLFKQKKQSSRKKKKKQQIVVSSSDENEDVPLDDDSDLSISDEEVAVNIGDFVIVKVAGRARTVRYIARIDQYDEEDNDYEGVFLERVHQKLGEEHCDQRFVVNEESQYSFGATEILTKLPYPDIVGGSSRRSNYLQFSFDFTKWDLAY